MSRLGKKFKKSSDGNKTYAENEYFSQRHRQWARYHVLRPRLPRPTDEKWLETVFQPRTLKSFVGKHNHEAIVFSLFSLPCLSCFEQIIETLSHIRDNFEVGQSFPSQFVLYGPPGSGKSALVRTLLREMNESCGVDQSNSPKWILQVGEYLDCDSHLPVD
jgi:Cdc6-like AAA superfamily ATPase